MAKRVALHHQTRYDYDRVIALGPHLVRLRPAPHTRTPVISYTLSVVPEAHFLNWQQDPFGNFMARLVFPDKTQQLRVTVDLVTDMSVINPFDFFVEPDAAAFPFVYEPWLKKALVSYLEIDPMTPKLSALMDVLPKQADQTVGLLVELNGAICERVAYLTRMEPGVQTPEETLELGKGSCRDTAWLLVQVLRHMGLASRFVSGYLIQLKPDEKPLEGPTVEHDAAELHAWAEVYIPGAGWIGMDPTSGLLTGEGHIPLAATPWPSNAAPVSGSHETCESVLHHEMRVTRLQDDPTVS